MEDVMMQVDMEPHELQGSYPFFGMMNLIRGCSWYEWITLPSS
jgi:hypothetical protein